MTERDEQPAGQAADPWAVRKEIARRLGESYPAWNVWISPRTWWATRRTPLPDGSLKRGLYMTLTADSPDELRSQLDEQTERQRRYRHRPRAWQ